jgi:hypothetical protein
MYIRHYEECCALKLAVDWWDLTSLDMEELCRRVMTHVERNQLEFNGDRDDDYHRGDSEVNNRILISIIPAQRVYLNKFKQYIKTNKKPVEIVLLTKFANPKTGNLVYLYMAQRKENGLKKKKLAA